MRRSLTAYLRNPRPYLAGALGISFGLFAYSYWLVDLLPAASRLLALLTVLAMALGAAGYTLLLNWSAPRFVALAASSRLALLTAGFLSGVALLFGGTTGWLTPTRSIPFLLPIHRLQIQAAGATGDPGLALLWFKTSLGDVSYDTLHYSGWKRAGDELVLQNGEANGLVWTGRTGGSVEMVWRGSRNDSVEISWDGQATDLNPAAGKFTYSRSFAVPWYASRGLVIALGILVFVSLATALCLLAWEKRASFLPQLQGALRLNSRPLNGLDAALLAGAAVLALLFRLPNLGGLYPAVDEYFHLIAARQILEGAALSSVYERGLLLVTLPITLSLRLFGYQLWAARLPGLLFNALAIVPLYLLTRKINRTVAVFSVLLYATSPWIVTFARIAREYAYYPFYFYWIVLGMVVFLERIPQSFVLLRDWRKALSGKTVLIGLVLAAPPLFAFYGDRLSTFRTILIAYLVFGVFALARFNFRDRSNWPFLSVLGLGLIVVAYVWYESQKSKIADSLAFNPVPVSYFAPNPQQQWYYDRLVPLLLLAILGAALCGYLLRRVNFIPLFLLGLYAGGIGFFAFFSKTFFHTRHLLTTELWFVTVVAFGLYVLWKWCVALSPWRRPYANVLLALAVSVSLINWRQLIEPITSTNPNDPISEDYLHDMSQVHAFMLGHAQPHDVLISTVYGLYSSWKEAPAFVARYRITTETPREQIFGLIDQHASGWIVIDQIRLDMSTLGPQEFAGNPDVEYIGLFGDESVWHWQHASGGLGNSMVAGKGK